MFLNEKNTRKKILSWITAAIAAVICVNFLCLFYIREPGGAERSGGAIYAISQPGRISVNCEEGYGFNKTDRNGYTNYTDNLAQDGYVIILGNSMTRATNVFPEDRYVQQLNKMFADSIGGDASETAYAYSITRGGALFAELASGYDAAIEEYPNAKAVVIQLAFSNKDMEINKDLLDKVYAQREYDYTQTAEYIFENEGVFKRFKHCVKSSLPLIPFAQNRRFNKFGHPFSTAFGINWNALVYGKESECESDSILDDSESEKKEILVEALTYLNSKNDIPLIIIDMPEIKFFDEKSIEYNLYNQEIWKEACEEAGVPFIGMTEEFDNMYAYEGKLPYGFTNTTMGAGHLNKDGNRLVAKTLYQKLKELEVIE